VRERGDVTDGDSAIDRKVAPTERLDRPARRARDPPGDRADSVARNLARWVVVGCGRHSSTLGPRRSANDRFAGEHARVASIILQHASHRFYSLV
jgi:hypothetical protein